jgi:hypothetical protein
MSRAPHPTAERAATAQNAQKRPRSASRDHRGRDHPAGATHRPGDRPGHWRAHGRGDAFSSGWRQTSREAPLGVVMYVVGRFVPVRVRSSTRARAGRSTIAAKTSVPQMTAVASRAGASAPTGLSPGRRRAADQPLTATGGSAFTGLLQLPPAAAHHKHHQHGDDDDQAEDDHGPLPSITSESTEPTPDAQSMLETYN